MRLRLAHPCVSDDINVIRKEFRRNCTILNFRFEQDVLNRKSRSNWVTLNEKFVEFFLTTFTMI